MASLLIKLCVVAVSLCQYFTDGRTVSRSSSSRWRDCTAPNSPLRITNFEISPNPVSLPGEILLTIEGYSNRTIGSSSMQLQIVRKMKNSWFGDFEIPCLFKIGSCTYPDMCTMLREMKTENWAGMTSQLSEDIRNMLIDHNMNPDGCPQPPQQLSIVRYPLRLPEIPTILSWFSDGDYEAHVTVTDNSNNEELTCLDLEIEVRTPEEEEEECDGWLCMFG